MAYETPSSGPTLSQYRRDPAPRRLVVLLDSFGFLHFPLLHLGTRAGEKRRPWNMRIGNQTPGCLCMLPCMVINVMNKQLNNQGASPCVGPDFYDFAGGGEGCELEPKLRDLKDLNSLRVPWCAICKWAKDDPFIGWFFNRCLRLFGHLNFSVWISCNVAHLGRISTLLWQHVSDPHSKGQVGDTVKYIREKTTLISALACCKML